MATVVQFPSNLNKYIDFKTDSNKVEQFNRVLEAVLDDIEEGYPEAADMDPSDYILIAEAITSAIMRVNDIEHPLQEFAEKNMVPFFEEYGF